MSDPLMNTPLVPPPIDYADIRKTIVAVLSKITGLRTIEHEPESPDAPRPPKPYMAFKITSAAIKYGDDESRQVYDGSTPTTQFVSGGQRKMAVSLHAYGRSKEEAYSFMALVQAGLQLHSIRELFNRAALAVWTVGNVADLSALLNTGYEGRAQMDVDFGVASNIVEDLGSIDEVAIQGAINTGIETVETELDVEL